MLLGLYPITELTRVILLYAYRYGDLEFTLLATYEITLMWILYMLIIPVLVLVIKEE